MLLNYIFFLSLWKFDTVIMIFFFLIDSEYDSGKHLDYSWITKSTQNETLIRYGYPKK